MRKLWKTRKLVGFYTDDKKRVRPITKGYGRIEQKKKLDSLTRHMNQFVVPEVEQHLYTVTMTYMDGGRERLSIPALSYQNALVISLQQRRSNKIPKRIRLKEVD